MLTKNRFFIGMVSIYIICMQAFILLSNKGDETVYLCLNRSGTLTDIFKLITRFGEFIGLIGIGLYLAVKNRKALLAAALSFSWMTQTASEVSSQSMTQMAVMLTCFHFLTFVSSSL